MRDIISPKRNCFGADSTILDEWSANRNLSLDHVPKSWLVALPDKCFLQDSNSPVTALIRT